MSCLSSTFRTRNGHLGYRRSLAPQLFLRSYNIAIRRARQISGYAVTRLEVGRVMKYEINEI